MPRFGWPALKRFSMNLAIQACSASQNSCSFGAKPVDAPASPLPNFTTAEEDVHI